MNRKLERFEKPDLTKTTEWGKIFEVYNQNFDKLYDFLVTLGTNYNVESFSNVSRDITLSHSYVPGNNQLLVFVDGAVQWCNVDYKESGSNSITMLKDVDASSEVRVIVVESFSTYTDTSEFVEKIRNIYNDAVVLKDDAKSIYLNVVDLYQKVMKEMSKAGAETANIQQMLDNISRLASEAEKAKDDSKAYLNEIKALADGITGESSDAQLAEVKAARGGHPTLGARLDKYAYFYNTVNDLKVATIETDAQCVVFGEEIVGDTQTKVYKVVKSQSDIPKGTDDYVELNDGRFAYLVTIFSGKGSGGGGGGEASVTLESLIDTNVTIAAGTDCIIRYSFETTIGSSASVKYYVNDALKYSGSIVEGEQSFNVGPYISGESSVVEVVVTDRGGGVGTLTYVVKSVSLSIKSTFDEMAAYNSSVLFRYTATGEVTKYVHFELDGVDQGTDTVVSSGTQMGKTFPFPGHGDHHLKVWVTASIDGVNLTSNVLEYDFIAYSESNSSEIICSSFKDGGSYSEGDFITIPYRVYKVGVNTLNVALVANDETKSSVVSADRTTQYWTISSLPVGANKLEIRCGNTRKTFNVTVVKSEVDLSPVTANLKLDLSAEGRSNNSSDWDSWIYKDITATLTGFNRSTDGWLISDKGEAMLRLIGSARVSIPIYPFAVDSRANGLTIEVEFESRDAANRDTTLIECMANNVGIRVTPQTALFSSEQLNEKTGAAVLTKFKENERIRVTFVVQPRTEERLVEVYVNGIASRAARYQLSDNFYQNTAAPIVIGSDEANIDIYRIRVYDTALSMKQVMQNYWADRPTLKERMEVYQRNDILNEDSSASYSKISKVMPCMTIIGELPPKKGEKRVVSIRFVNPNDPTKNFEADNVKIDVQGTSSQYYPRKNWKIKGVPKYQLRDNSIPEGTFCLKANYMDSSSCRNTCLAVLINDLVKKVSPTTPQKSDERVRTTVDGYVMSLFYQENESATPVCHGIYCFNNDKSNLDTFGFGEGVQCWEFCNNTSNLCLFDTDSDEGFFDAFEARYPEDYTDTTEMMKLIRWVYSTKNDPAKFKKELSDWFDVDALISYYLICITFGLVDSLAKNMFLVKWEGEKWRPIFYDMDTCFGLNNEGVNSFYPDMELTDKIVGTESYCFNAHGSVLWNNVEATCQSEMKTMYKFLRDNGMDYDNMVKVFYTDHIAKIPEALYNIDSDFKYIGPIREDNDDTYLYILQGSSYDYWRWWVDRTFFYNDSRFDYYTVEADYLTLRSYNQEPVDVELYCYDSMYVKYKFGSVNGKKRVRISEQDHCTVSALQKYTDTETIFYGASNITKLDNLSALKPGTIDISRAVRLSELYPSLSEDQNGNLVSISAGNNDILRTVWAEYAINMVGSLILSNCLNIRTVRVNGTKLSSVELPDGGSVEKLYYNDLMSSLTIKNQPKLTTLSGGWSNLTTLVLENVPNIDIGSIISSASKLVRVRLIGVYISADNLLMLDSLAKMAGIDENGNVVSTPIVTGQFYARGASTKQLKEYQERYATIFPELEVTAKAPVFYTGKFINWDGTVLDTQSVEFGEALIDPLTRAENPIETPTRPDDEVATNYKFKGWGDSLTNMTGERWITTNWDCTKRRFNVTLRNNGETLNDYEIDYNESVSFYDENFAYKGEVKDGDNWQFWKWSKPIDHITSNRVCDAIWVNVKDSFTDSEGNTITRLKVPETEAYKQFADFSWKEIKEIGKAGLAKFWFEIGDEKDITLSDGETITVWIEDFDHDFVDETCEVVHPYSIGMKNLMKNPHRMNPYTGTNGDDSTVGGWRDSEMLTYLEEIFKKLPATLQSLITDTCKVSCEGGLSYTLQKVLSKLWLRSPNEVGANRTDEPAAFAGKKYPIYTNNESRIKYYSNGTLSAGIWWLRLPYRWGPRVFWFVYSSGSIGGWCVAWGGIGVSFGFGF